MVPTEGYVAPPLDGIWATAPYPHNGSIPTLSNLLDSRSRPKRWQRSFGTRLDQDYDREGVGWKVVRDPKVTEANEQKVYDTSKPGYGNQGHTFGDRLDADERAALIEYLKSL